MFNSRKQRETSWFYIFVLPWILGFIFLTAIPLLFGLYYSFTNYNGVNINDLRFVGLANYERAFADRNVWTSVERTIYYTIITVPIGIALSLLIGFWMTLDIPFKGLYRVLFYIPHIIPLAAATWVWKLLFEKNFGLVNGIISAFSPGTAVGWFVDFPTETMTFFILWLGTGGGMIVFIAGLQGIPKDLLEAARVDGANAWDQFRLVTLPLLTPVLLFQLVLGLIRSLQIMIEPMLLSPTSNGTLGAAVPVANRFFMVNAYREMFTSNRFGYGSALIWMMFVVSVLLAILILGTSRFWVFSDDTRTENSN
jgi:multiple sugar transport system permease protein